MRTINLLFSLLLASTMTPVCRANDREIQSIFELPRLQRIERFEKLDLGAQYSAYIYGVQVIHPPMLELARPIAMRGKSAIPFLLQKLSATHADVEIRDIVLIFFEMSRLKIYAVNKQLDLISSLQSAIDHMESGEWKDSALIMLAEINTHIYANN